MGNPTHRKSKHPLFNRWALILDRCCNTKSKDYPFYGERGIRICPQWKDDFMTFFDYMMGLPHALEPGYTIDRMNNDGHYEPNNMRWATHQEQMINRRQQKNNKSGYRGVSNAQGKFRSVVKTNGIINHIGTFETALQAAEARDMYIIKNGLWQYPLQVIKEGEG